MHWSAATSTGANICVTDNSVIEFQTISVYGDGLFTFRGKKQGDLYHIRAEIFVIFLT